MSVFSGACNIFRRPRTYANPRPAGWLAMQAAPPRPDLGNCADCLAAHPTKELRGIPPLCKPCRRARRDS